MARLRFKELGFGKLTIYEVAGVKGDFIDIITEADTPQESVVGKTLYVEGEANLTRTLGEAGENFVAVRKAGDSSMDLQKYSHIKAGTLRMRVTSDTFKYFCISNPDKKKLHGKTLRPVAGDSFYIQKGHYLFLAKGSVSTLVGGVEKVFNAPNLVEISSKRFTFKALEDAMIAQIKVPNKE